MIYMNLQTSQNYEGDRLRMTLGMSSEKNSTSANTSVKVISFSFQFSWVTTSRLFSTTNLENRKNIELIKQKREQNSTVHQLNKKQKQAKQH